MFLNNELEEVINTKILALENLVSMIATEVFSSDPDFKRLITETMIGNIHPDDEGEIWDDLSGFIRRDSRVCCIIAAINVYKAKYCVSNLDYPNAIHFMTQGCFYAGGAADFQDGVKEISSKASAKAGIRHEENRAAKKLAVEHYTENRQKYKNKDDAAYEISKKIVGYSSSTVRDWLKGV